MTIVHIVPVLKDNYCYILEMNGRSAIIDPGEADPVINYCKNNDITPELIINTHHHGDHIAGNTKLAETYNCQIAAPKAEADKIGRVEIPLDEKHVFEFAGEKARILETPGHTLGHICLYFEKDRILFSGDTLFSLGCGRLFEGSAEQMWKSLQKILELPDDTRIYPGHEYTKANAEFCLSIDPDNSDLKERYEQVMLAAHNNQPTIPVTLAIEKKTNAFLRVNSALEFADLRQKKDSF